MAEDEEVELEDEGGEEYEVIPMGPIRRLEKRIDEMEQASELSSSETLVRDMMDMMQSNQQMVNSMVKSTHELRNSVEDLAHKMDDVVDNMNEFMDLLEEASEASLEDEVSRDLGESLVNPITKKMDELNDTNRRMLEGLSSLSEGVSKLDDRMKKVYASQKGEMFQRPSRSRRARGSREGQRERNPQAERGS